MNEQVRITPFGYPNQIVRVARQKCPASRTKWFVDCKFHDIPLQTETLCPIGFCTI